MVYLPTMKFEMFQNITILTLQLLRASHERPVSISVKLLHARKVTCMRNKQAILCTFI